MEVTAQLSEFIRVHGQHIANLWLERIEPSLEPAQLHQRQELEKSMQRCLSYVAETLGGRVGDASSGELDAGPRLDPCLALLGYDLLIDAIRDVANELHAELVASGLQAAAGQIARAISEHAVEHGSDQGRRAHDFMQARMAQLAFDRQEAERRAALLMAAFEQMPAGFGVADASGRVLLANPQLKRVLGESQTACLEDCRRLSKTPGNGAAAAHEWPLATALRQHQTVRHELFELERVDSGRVVIEISAAPVTAFDHACAVVIVEDVTDRQRQFHDLDRVWNLARDLLCVVGTDTYFKRVNPAFTRILGHTEEELLATSLLEFVHPDDCPSTVLEMRKSAQGVPTVHFENRYRCRDGTYKWLAWSATPVPEERVAYAVARDVSDDHRFGDAQALLTRFGSLVASCLDYESTLANVARMVVPTLADWCSIDMLGADGKLSCMEVACSDSTKFALAARLRSASPKRPEHPALRALKSGRLSSIPEVTPERLRAIANDARHLDALTVLGPRSMVSVPLQVRGQILGVLTLVMAESGRRHVPEDLMLVQDLSRRAAQALDNARLFSEAREHVAFEQRVVAVVSHDLRNPLTAIAMVVTRMLHEQRDAKHEQQLLLVQRSVQRALGLVSDLLDVARARVTGGIPLHPVAASLEELVLQVVEEARASHPERSVEVHVDGNVRGTWDIHRMAQVATNLIVNALTYGTQGAAVKVNLRDLGEDVELSVQNFGKAIPTQAHAPLFDAMQRGPHGENENGGLGLGLFIAKQIVIAHHGTIAVKSSDVEGTTFTVRLPRSFRRDSDHGGVHLSESRPRHN